MSTQKPSICSLKAVEEAGSAKDKRYTAVKSEPDAHVQEGGVSAPHMTPEQNFGTSPSRNDTTLEDLETFMAGDALNRRKPPSTITGLSASRHNQASKARQQQLAAPGRAATGSCSHDLTELFEMQETTERLRNMSLN